MCTELTQILCSGNQLSLALSVRRTKQYWNFLISWYYTILWYCAYCDIEQYHEIEQYHDIKLYHEIEQYHDIAQYHEYQGPQTAGDTYSLEYDWQRPLSYILF